MTRLLIAATLTVAIALLPLAALAQRGATVAEQYLLQMTNEHRAQQGLAPLAWDAALARAAHNHALRIMQDGGIAQHQYPGESDPKTRAVQAGAHFSTVSENVAGNASSAMELDHAWMNSRVHRDNILDPNLNVVGISVVKGRGVLYAVEDFARAVAVLDRSELEQQALQFLRKQRIRPAASTATQQDARRICQQPDSTADGPILIMQWDGADLAHLPADLLQEMPSARSHTVAVGACNSERRDQGFTTYHLAVLVY